MPAGEGGYLLLAANFERFRQKARTELSSQDAIGRVQAVRGLLPFIEAFEPLQAAAVEAGEAEAKIHNFYSGVYKQLGTLLEQWEVCTPHAVTLALRGTLLADASVRACPQVESFVAVPGEAMDFSRHVALERCGCRLQE